MKIITFCLIAWVVSTTCARIRAEEIQSTNDSASALASAAKKLARATNNEVILTKTTGRVVAFSSKGYILRSNEDYLPRVSLTNVSEADFQVLLESRTVYDALTIFGNSPRTAGSSYFEECLRNIWLKGNSLADKIQARMLLLEAMRGYNDSVTAYVTTVGFADNANLIEKNASNAEQSASTAVANATQQLASANSRIEFHLARKDLTQATADLNNQTETANGAASLSTNMQQRAEIYRMICAQYANLLARYDIQVRERPPFGLIPPLSMRLEVDIDRLSTTSRSQAVSPE